MTDTQEEKNLEQEELQEEEESIAPWVQWFRVSAPHIHSIKKSDYRYRRFRRND